jgi:hypothetical protein
VDDPQTRAWEQLTEYRVLLDLTMERMVDLQRDFMVLRAEMVRCYALLGALPTGPEPSGQEPSPADLWGDQTSA